MDKIANSTLPEDHYVARTYLKRFANERGKIWVYNKQLLTVNERSTKSVCKEAGGSNNPYFTKERIIEDYLKVFENRWAWAVDILSSEDPLDLELYRQAKRVIAGYLGYLKFAPPAAVGAGQAMLATKIKATMVLLKKQNKISPPPSELEFLLDDWENQISVEVDPKFHQAMGATAMHDVGKTLYNSPWMRIFNKNNEPFITSDNPACIWYPKPKSSGMHYLPLSPTVAILIKPRLETSTETFDHSTDALSDVKPNFVSEINSHIIKCASSLVISNKQYQTIHNAVIEFKDWSYKCFSQRIDTDSGVFSIDRWQAIKSEQKGLRKNHVK